MAVVVTFCEHCGMLEPEFDRSGSICTLDHGEEGLHHFTEGTARERADALVMGISALIEFGSAEDIVRDLHGGKLHGSVEMLHINASIHESCMNYLKGAHIEEVIDVVGRAYS